MTPVLRNSSACGYKSDVYLAPFLLSTPRNYLGDRAVTVLRAVRHTLSFVPASLNTRHRSRHSFGLAPSCSSADFFLPLSLLLLANDALSVKATD